MNHLQQHREEFIQESREAGQRAFDVIFERLHYRHLYWMS
jgi:hypothetical protein